MHGADHNKSKDKQPEGRPNFYLYNIQKQKIDQKHKSNWTHDGQVFTSTTYCVKYSDAFNVISIAIKNKLILFRTNNSIWDEFKAQVSSCKRNSYKGVKL